jgi:hypothetical protein
MGLEFSWEPTVYRNKLGRIIEADELDILLRDREYAVVNIESVGPYLVSTAWLGVPDMSGAYFETVVFDNVGDSLELYRYATIKEAEEGHKRVVREWRTK